MRIISLFLILLLGLLSLRTVAQPPTELINVSVVPNSKNWNYHLGESVLFEVVVTQNGILLEGVEIRYELSCDMMPAFKEERLCLKDGRLKIEGGTMNEPGFLRCRVFASYGKKEYEGRATAGFEPERIIPVATQPLDFDSFWEEERAKSRQAPLDARLRLLPERCSAFSNVYELSIRNNKEGARVYGILCVPKASGKYPALLRLPGAGVRGYAGHVSGADNGYITLEIGIHGIPLTMDKDLYEGLAMGALNSYPLKGLENKEEAYLKRVYLGCIRAVDFISGMEEFDGKNILVQGGSQGGALAIVTAAMDDRVTALIAFFPALCDLNGYLHGRAGGWPHFFKKTTDTACIIEEKATNTSYYDVVNFARRLRTPGFYSFGYNDMVCPPTSMFSAYNVITAPKTIFLLPATAHYAHPEQWNQGWQWWEEYKNQ